MQTLLNALKSKTIIFSVLLAVLSVAQGYIGLFVLDQKTQALVGMGIAGAIALLRAVTTTSLLEK
jgi:hypothetical protein